MSKGGLGCGGVPLKGIKLEGGSRAHSTLTGGQAMVLHHQVAGQGGGRTLNWQSEAHRIAL
jgi:hypothetical protein